MGLERDDDAIVREGLPWSQRLDQPPPTGPHGDLGPWRRAVDPDDAGLFERRLAWDGLSERQAQGVLAGSPDTSPDWLPELHALLAGFSHEGGALDGYDDLPFAPVLAPLIQRAWDHLLDRGEPRLLDGWSPSAQAALRRDLGSRMAEVSAKAFYDDFSARRSAGADLMLRLGLTGGGDEAFQQWCRDQRDDALAGLLRTYPVLGRLLAVTTANWRRATLALLERTRRHRPELAAALGIPVDAHVVGVRTGLSDPHRGGHRVVVLDFDDAPSAVYKPKDLRMEAGFNTLVRMVNDRFDDFAIGEVQVVAAAGYGFTSLVAHRWSTEPELPGFYVAAGRLLALLYVLGATDAHYENVIATGPSQALIDPETLFHAHAMSGSAAMTDTVLRTGMLPGWLINGPGQPAHDPSALGVSVVAERTVADWVDVNTDDMAWRAAPRQTPQIPSLPVPLDQPNPVAEHAENIVRGFAEVYRLCLEPDFRSRLLEQVTAFHGFAQRVVLRSTRVYAVTQQRALSAAALGNGSARGLELERLARRALTEDTRDPHWEVYRAELQDMEQLDIPYFEHILGAGEVTGSRGPIPGLALRDAIGATQSHILAMDVADLARQEHLIRATIRARFLDFDRAAAAAPRPPGPTDHIDAAVAVDLLESLPDDASTILALTVLPDGRHVRIGPLGDGWYDGRTGIAAVRGGSILAPVVAALGTDDGPARTRYLRDLGLGFAGTGGLLRMPWPDRRLVQNVIEALPPSLVRRDRALDVMGGVAGLLLPLARIHAEHPNPPTEALLIAAADHLMSAQRGDGGWDSPMASRPLTGLAHGAAGCGLALLEAGVALRRDDWIDAGAAALRYEAAWFDPATGNWPDFRDEARAPMVAWCHGAAGIGLTRLRALTVLPDHPDAPVWREELAAAMSTTAHAPDQGTDHLCCGLTGRAAVLRIVGRATGEEQWLQHSAELTSRVMRGYRETGRFSLPLDDPDVLGTAAPGLMTGTAGIVAHLMSIQKDRDLAGLLL